MGWLIFLAILIFLSLIPLGVRVQYNESGTLAEAKIGFVKLKLYPRKKQEKKPVAKKDKKQEKETLPKPKPAEPETPVKGGSILDFLPLVRVALEFLGSLRRKLRVDRLFLHVVMAGDDPCDLATNYGAANVGLGLLWPKLEQWLVIKKRDVSLNCDFLASETLVTADVQITITLGRILALGTRFGIRALQELLKIKKLRKGGKGHESDIT